MADAQAAVQAVLDELVERDQERGLQVAAYLDGELVVDAWSGIADPATGREVDGDTLFTVFSTTKGFTATVIHLLAERGLLDYDTPIARYWPEFAAHGKAGITVRHALTHTAGGCPICRTGRRRPTCATGRPSAAASPRWSRCGSRGPRPAITR